VSNGCVPDVVSFMLRCLFMLKGNPILVDFSCGLTCQRRFVTYWVVVSSSSSIALQYKMVEPSYQELNASQ
jgi:hypothetical protein